HAIQENEGMLSVAFDTLEVRLDEDDLLLAEGAIEGLRRREGRTAHPVRSVRRGRDHGLEDGVLPAAIRKHLFQGPGAIAPDRRDDGDPTLLQVPEVGLVAVPSEDRRG